VFLVVRVKIDRPSCTISHTNHFARRNSVEKKIQLKKYWPSNIFDVPIIAQLARNAQQEEACLPIVQWVKRPVHNVSFDWFLSDLEWILNFEFCLLTKICDILPEIIIEYEI